MTITSYNPNFIYIIGKNYCYKFYNGKAYSIKATLELAMQETHPIWTPMGDSLSFLKARDVVAIYDPDLHPELFL